MGVTHDGRIAYWKVKARKSGTTPVNNVRFAPRIVAGLSGIKIKSVACGDSFSACLSDRGILMTFGSGAQGCLGHGDYEDVGTARMVEALLGFEVTRVSCGDAHIAAITSDNECFLWGCGTNGRLGLGSDETVCTPTAIRTLPSQYKVESVSCGPDCTFFISTEATLLACGSNRLVSLREGECVCVWKEKKGRE